jgi:hypothetical protein
VRRAFLHTGSLSLTVLTAMRLRMLLLCWPTQQCLRTNSMTGRLPVWRTHCDSCALHWQLFAADAVYGRKVLASGEAGPNFFTRLQQSGLDKVLQQEVATEQQWAAGGD